MTPHPIPRRTKFTPNERAALELALDDLHKAIEAGELEAWEVCEYLGDRQTHWENRFEDPNWIREQAQADGADYDRKAGA